MNENEVFRDPIQELERLREDLNQMKGLLKDIAQRMTQIERHVKRAFVPASKQESGGNSVPRQKRSSKPAEPPTIDAQQALVLFDELKSILTSDGSQTVINRLEQMSIPNLKLMARELGLTFKSKPSKKVLSHKILGRMNESVMLSKNVNVTQPRSVEIQGEREETQEEVKEERAV